MRETPPFERPVSAHLPRYRAFQRRSPSRALSLRSARRQEPLFMPHSRPCPNGLNLDKLDRGHCLAECDMTSGQKLPSQGEREVQRPTRAGRQNALHVQSQGRGIACQPHICACEPPRIGGKPGVSNPYTEFAVTVLSTHSPAGSGGHRNTTHHCLPPSRAARQLDRTSDFFLRNVPGFREASN